MQGSGYDVIVVGTGGAGLSAALSAHDAGAKVVLIEVASRENRGGNTSYTGGAYAFPHTGLAEIRELCPELSDEEAGCLVLPSCSEDQLYSYWMRMTQGLADPELVETVVTQANPTIRWLGQMGMQWAPFTTFAIRSEGKIKWQTGMLVLESKAGGTGISDTLFEAAEQRGIEIRYGTRATKLIISPKGEVQGVVTKTIDGFDDVMGKNVILACGGFEANREMRCRYLGPNWEMGRIRGTKNNMGEGLKMALEIGAQPWGHWSCGSGALIDANAPYFPEKEVGDSTNRSSTCYGILSNTNGDRFLDEGEDIRTATYARFGSAAIAQPDAMAYQIFDAKVHYLLEDRYATSTPVTADTIEELAEKLSAPNLVKTIRSFNAAVQEGTFDPLRKDGKRTEGVVPPKSNWAMKLDAPPYTAYPVTGGLSFTYGGIRINCKAQVLDVQDQVIPGLYATGEIVGGLFYYCYVGGGGLMAGAVFGRIAGTECARG